MLIGNGGPGDPEPGRPAVSHPPEAAALISLANRLADAARPIALRYFRDASLDATSKQADGFDPVTEADRCGEAAMRGLLGLIRPQDAILGEEFGAQPGTSGLTWVLDPIDGTRGYIAGTPTWGVLIAVRDAQRVLYGVIDQPYTTERFSGGLGEARFAGPNGVHRMTTRPPRPLAQAILFSTFPEIGTQAERAAFGRVAGAVRLTRYGLDCYAYGLLALGQIDLVIEAGLHAYDVAAPIAVIEAAGGIVTDWQGAPVLEGGQVVAAANREIHAEALRLLNA